MVTFGHRCGRRIPNGDLVLTHASLMESGHSVGQVAWAIVALVDAEETDDHDDDEYRLQLPPSRPTLQSKNGVCVGDKINVKLIERRRP